MLVVIEYLAVERNRKSPPASHSTVKPHVGRESGSRQGWGKYKRDQREEDEVDL